MENEIWKPIQRTDGFYEVSNLGRIRRAKPGKGARVGKILIPPIGLNGYVIHTLFFNKKMVADTAHSFVAGEFIGPRKKGYDINHKNKIRHDNRSENLEYCTRRGNVNYSYGRSISSEEIIKKCKECSEPYSVHPYRKDSAKYCSRKCANIGKQFFCKEKSSNWRGGNVLLHCSECKKEFYVIKSRATKALVCSLKCRYSRQKRLPSPKKGKHYPHLKKIKTTLPKPT